jgi:hypothetical protein
MAPKKLVPSFGFWSIPPSYNADIAWIYLCFYHSFITKAARNARDRIIYVNANALGEA